MQEKKEYRPEQAAGQGPEKKKRARWVTRILTVVCLGVFVFSAWKLGGIWMENHQVQKETSELRNYLQAKPAPSPSDSSQTAAPADFTVDWAGLKAANPNVTAWLIVPGTGISYPVVQASDNSYYLNHSFTGAPNYIGAIFLDAGATPDYRQDNSIIYGHSVDIGGMFTSLKEFENKEFFDSHPYFWLLTPQQNYRVDIRAFYRGGDDSAIYTTDFGDYRPEVLKQIDEEALYTRPVSEKDGSFVTLSTCNLEYGLASDQRYVLMGALQPWNDPIPLNEES